MEHIGQRRLGVWWGQCSMSMLVSACALVLAGGLVTAPAWADDGEKDHKPDPAARLEKLTKKLSLTEAQQAKIRPILEEKVKKMQALHEQMKTVRTQSMDQIEAELTEEQKVKFRKQREEHKGKKHDRHDKHGKKKDRDSDDHD